MVVNKSDDNNKINYFPDVHFTNAVNPPFDENQ